MTKFVKVANGEVVKYPYTYFDLISEFPGRSFDFPLPLYTQIEIGVFYVIDTDPNPGPLEKYEEVNPVQEFGSWIQSWVKVDLTPIETAERIEKKWEQVRELRDQILVETDQTQLPDRPIDEDLRLAYADYRQSLRDITLQPDPFNIEWPERPE